MNDRADTADINSGGILFRRADTKGNRLWLRNFCNAVFSVPHRYAYPCGGGVNLCLGNYFRI